VTTCIISARENARQIAMPSAPSSGSASIGSFMRLTGCVRPRLRTQLSEFLPALIDGVHLFQGVTDTTLSHGEGWQFFRWADIWSVHHPSPSCWECMSARFSVGLKDSVDADEYLEWIGLLRCCTAFEAYCKVYTADLTHGRILNFSCSILNSRTPSAIHQLPAPIS